jgi:hypothetical protein
MISTPHMANTGRLAHALHQLSVLREFKLSPASD